MSVGSPRSADLARLVAAAAVALVMGACLTEPEPMGPNEAPSASIAQPTAALTFKGGDSIAYSGSASDREDGTEPGSRLTWWVELHHDTHTHPFMPRTTGASGKLFVPPIGETSDNVFLRLYLEALDDSGKADTVSRDILPQKVQFTLATEPGGLSVTLDGQPRVVPLTITGVVGMEREVGVTTPQADGPTSYNFSSWSDGGAATHRITTPAVSTTYTARFGAVVNQLPTVSITAPSGGASLTVNTATTITATAADADGSVSTVEFLDGTTLLGTDASSPYTLAWTPSTTGTHSLTARAIDNQAGSRTSTAVSVSVNLPVNRLPTVSLTAPANGASVTVNTSVTLSASASDPDGSVVKVEFLDGASKLGEDGTSPYSFSWVPTVTGAHSITARVTDDRGGTTTSTAASVTVNAAANVPPTATLTAPASGATLVTGVATTMTATASDPGGSVSRVEFYDGGTKLGEDATSPYAFSWTPSTTMTGTRSLTARAIDNLGAAGASAAVSVTVNLPPNVNPTATLTAPANGATLLRGVATTLTATAADADGTVAKVGFYDGTTLLNEDTTAPYSFSWTPSTTGAHVLTARATDNRAGTGTSTAVNVTVNNRLPTAALTSPASGATLTVNTATTLTATAADADGTVAKVGFYDGATLLGEDTTSPYSFSWTPTVTGGHSITARATDNNGGVGNSSAVPVTVASSGPDTQAPTLTLTSPAGQTTGITGSPTFTVTTADNVGVTAVDYQVDGDAVGTASSSPWSFTLSAASAYTTGVHVIRARARDAAGNQSAWSAARVTFGGDEDLPNGFTRTTYVQGLGLTTAMAFAPDGRLFICEQDGALRVVKGGVLLGTPFVSLTVDANGERGLLGVAFHPQYATNRWVYVYYTTASGGVHNRISRFTASSTTPDVAQAGSEVIIADLPALGATNHNGGALHFGPDGKLYVAVGENAVPSNAQSLGTRLGKMLRYNDDGTIPSDNPLLASTSGVNQAIWALGLRNPFSFAFDPGSTRMFINDVGQSTWEEINLGRASANFGWPTFEGATTAAGYDSPLYTYGHSSNNSLVTGIAIVGGAFYRPSTTMFPASWVGHYFFGDYGGGFVNRLDPANGNAVYAFARLGTMTDVHVGNDGALYVLADVGNGWGVFRFSRP